MSNETETAPPLMTGKASDIPVPSLGTPEPSGPIPGMPLTGEISNGPPRGNRRARGRRTLPSAESELASMPESSAATPPDPDAIAALSVSITNAATVIFSIVAVARNNKDWNLQEKDAKTLGDSGAVALAPYMGDAGKWAPLALFILNLAGVVMPRLQSDREKAEAETRANPQPIQVIP